MLHMTIYGVTLGKYKVNSRKIYLFRSVLYTKRNSDISDLTFAKDC